MEKLGQTFTLNTSLASIICISPRDKITIRAPRANYRIQEGAWHLELSLFSSEQTRKKNGHLGPQASLNAMALPTELA